MTHKILVQVLASAPRQKLLVKFGAIDSAAKFDLVTQLSKKLSKYTSTGRITVSHNDNEFIISHFNFRDPDDIELAINAADEICTDVLEAHGYETLAGQLESYPQDFDFGFEVIGHKNAHESLRQYVRHVIRESLDDYDEEIRRHNERWEAFKNDPENKVHLDKLMNAADLKELARAKREVLKLDDAGKLKMPVGVWMSVYDKRKEELKDMRDDEKRLSDPTKASADARMDRLLRIRTSSGKATPRKF